MESPEIQPRVASELPSAENAEWHAFSNPREAKENFEKILSETGEAA